jgi:hypothetical protein
MCANHTSLSIPYNYRTVMNKSSTFAFVFIETWSHDSQEEVTVGKKTLPDWWDM